MKKVFILNGASSSGKSTIAYNLQELLRARNNDEFAIVSIDDFLKMDVHEPIYEDDVFDIMPQMCERIKKELAISDGVIIDHVITSEKIYNMLLHELENYEVYKIKVSCSIKVLSERENKRGNRCIGSAEASQNYLFPTDGYNLLVDTTDMNAMECAGYIVEQLL